MSEATLWLVTLRAALRMLLGVELGMDPVGVSLTTGLHRRPMCPSLDGMQFTTAAART